MRFKIKNLSVFITLLLILFFTGYYTISQLSAIPVNPVSEMDNEYSSLNRYDYLSDNDKKIYNGIYEAILSQSKYKHASKRISNTELNNIFYILNYCVLIDHPEIFWVNGNVSESNGIIAFEYTISKKAALEYTKEIESIIDNAVNDAELENSSDYEKALWAYEWIINNTEYNYQLVEDEDMEDGDLIRQCWGAFIEGSTVCEGYSKAYSMLMHKLDIPCICVTGNSIESGESHEWNVISINGVNCHIDTTWGDSDTEIDYKYFAQSEDEISKEKSKDKYSVWPECNSTEYSYYKQSSCYIDEISINIVEEIIINQAESNRNPIQMQFASSELLLNMIENYIDTGIVYSIFTDLENQGYNMSKRTYYADENSNIIYLYY